MARYALNDYTTLAILSVATVRRLVPALEPLVARKVTRIPTSCCPGQYTEAPNRQTMNEVRKILGRLSSSDLTAVKKAVGLSPSDQWIYEEPSGSGPGRMVTI